MNETLFDKIIENWWQFAIVVIVLSIALIAIGKGVLEFLNQLKNIISTLLKEFSGKAPAKNASILNILLLVMLAVLIFMVISPSLLAQLGLTETDSTLGYSVTLIIVFCVTGVLSGWFIWLFHLEENAYKDIPQTKTEKSRNKNT